MTTLDLAPSKYPGGVGIWGALPAVYDTTSLPVERGVHVHARHTAGRNKVIDASYQEVRVRVGATSVAITEANATPYVAGAVLDLPLRDVSCPSCEAVHLDTGHFAVHPHQRHVCADCALEFLDAERSVGNPIISAKLQFGDVGRRVTTPGLPGPLRIEQNNPAFSGGILIWASNPAILWTAEKQEAEGIHVHAFRADTALPIVDETYQQVVIDGIGINVAMTRVFMIQQSLKHLRSTIQSLDCTRCGAKHFDEEAPFAVEPHRNHTCTECGLCVVTPTAIIANPIVDVLDRLYSNAQRHGLRKNPLAP